MRAGALATLDMLTLCSSGRALTPAPNAEPTAGVILGLTALALENDVRGLGAAPLREKRISVSVAAAFMSVSFTGSPSELRVRVLLAEPARALPLALEVFFDVDEDEGGLSFLPFAPAPELFFVAAAGSFSLFDCAALLLLALAVEDFFGGDRVRPWEPCDAECAGGGGGTRGASGLNTVRARFAGGGARIDAKRLWPAFALVVPDPDARGELYEGGAGCEACEG